MRKQSNSSAAGIGVLAAVLALCALASASLLFGRVLTYSQDEFVNVLPLTDEVAAPVSEAAAETPTASVTSVTNTGTAANPEFHMEADAEIFRLSYDNESGKTTVIGAEGNEDKLIAPGTSNLYQFTLQNSGNVALDYTLTMEAYVTGTDLWLPVNARVRDYNDNYLVGSADEMPDVMELNTVDESGELAAGRYAVYYLEWEWPFERGGDEEDAYDTMLGNLAVDEDLVLHINIRTTAEYDEEPEDPNAGLFQPPKTGDTAPVLLLSLLFVGSFVGICILLLALVKLGRKKEKPTEEETQNDDS